MAGQIPPPEDTEFEGDAFELELPEQADPTADPPGAEAEAVPLTRAEVQQLLAQQAQEFRRTLQSQLDKATSKTERRFKEIQAANTRALAMAKAANATPEVLAAMERTMEQDALKHAMGGGTQPDPAPEPEVEPDGTPGDTGGGAYEALMQTAYAIAEEVGGFKPGDPELAMIQQKASGATPRQYLESVMKAADAKAARLKATPPTKAARVPGLATRGLPATSNPIAHVDSETDLYNMAFTQATRRTKQ